VKLAMTQRANGRESMLVALPGLSACFEISVCLRTALLCGGTLTPALSQREREHERRCRIL
jgi:hypothetical protein